MANFQSMLLIDIGNTQIKVAEVSRGRLRLKKVVATVPLSYRKFENFVEDAGFCVFSSVVPRATKFLERFLAKRRIGFHRVGFKDALEIKIKYRSPSKIGPDRIATVLGAVWKFGVPVIVVDMGTAVTCELVNSKREYLGGVIFPGISLAASALSEKTALLPKAAFKKTSRIGSDTENCIRRGIFDCVAGGVERAVSDFRKIVPNAKVVFTGFGASFFRKRDFGFDFAKDDLLVFRGLLQISKNLYNQNQMTAGRHPAVEKNV